MQGPRLVCAAVFLCLLAGATAFNVELQHDVGNGEFTKAGAFKITQNTPKGRGVKVVLVRPALSAEDKTAFASLVERDGFYRLKVPGKAQKLPDSQDVVTSIRARCLVQAKFEEVFYLHVDGKDIVSSLDYNALTQNCRPGLDVSLPTAWEFSSTSEVLVRKATAAPVIDVPRLKLRDAQVADVLDDSAGGDGDKLGEDGKTQKKEEPKSFLEKNWMLLVFGGMLVMNVMGNLAPEPPGGGDKRR